MDSLSILKHARFFNRCLSAMPSAAQSEDSNKLALVYFCLHGLGLLKKLDFSCSERESFSQSIICEYKVDKPVYSGFRSTPWLRHAPDEYDMPNLSATFFALACFAALGADYSKFVDRNRIMRFVSMCQIKDGPSKGSFAPTLVRSTNLEDEPYGESDLRQCYVAAGIRKLLHYHSGLAHDIDTELLSRYVNSRQNYNFGLSSGYMDESHLGLTFCGVACLALIGKPLANVRATENWLVHRHVSGWNLPDADEDGAPSIDDSIIVAGFNGRENKPSDTCYSWWCTAALHILNSKIVSSLDLEAARAYLIQGTQSRMIGGFSKCPGANPDPFHAFLALGALSLWSESDGAPNALLDEIDSALVITQTLKAFVDRLVFSD